MAIKASERIIQKIKEFEAFVPNPEQDAKTGKTAIGYGNTHVKRTNATKEEADADLRNHIALLEKELSQNISRQDLSQNKQDVLIDKAYNLGVPKMKSFLAKVNEGNDKGAGDSIMDYAFTTDAKTGVKFPLKGLTKRAAYREQLWNSPDEVSTDQVQKQIETPVPNDKNTFQIDDFAMSEIESTAASVLTPSVPPGGVDRYASVRSNKFEIDDFTMGEIDKTANEVLSAPQEEVSPEDNKSAMDSMSLMTNGNPASQYLLKRSEAERISKGTGVSLMEAKALLDKYTPEEVLARNAHAMTAKVFPSVAKWSQNQDNYVLMRQTGDTTKNIEVKSRAMSTDNAFSKGGQKVNIQLKRASIHALMAGEAIDKNTGKKMLRDLDAESKTLAPTNNLEERKSIEGYRKQAVAGTRDLYKGEILKGGAEAAEGYIKYIASYIATPSLYGEDMVANAASFVPTILSMTGGVLTATGAPMAGLPIMAAGTSLTGLMSFGGSMDEELQKFSDSEGNIDYDSAYGDIEFLSKARKASSTYTGVMMAADLVLGKVAGGVGVVKNVITKQVIVKKGLVNAAKRLGATSVIGESGSEFAGSAAKSAYKGTFVEDLPENTFKSFEEAFLSPGMAGVIAGTTSAPRVIQRNAKKLISKIQSRTKAADGAETLKSTRAEAQSTPETAKAKAQVAELINDVAGYKGNTEDIYDADTEAPSSAELKEKNKSVTEGTILFSPSDFDDFVASAGFDPEVVIQNFSPEVQQAYHENRESDDRVVVNIGDWATFIEDDSLDGIDDIAYFPDNFVNGKEAKEDLLDISKDPLSFLNVELPPTPDQDEDVPPPVPGQEMLPPPVPQAATLDFIQEEDPGPMQIIDPNSPEGNIISRPIQLIAKGLNKKDTSVLKSIVAGIKRAASQSKNIDVKHAETLAKIQFDHLKYRSGVLGIPLKDLSKTNYGMLPDSKSIIIDDSGDVRVTTIIHGLHASKKLESEDVQGITKILLARSAKLNTVIHELGHNWLHDLARDSRTIFAIPEDQLTSAQIEYKKAMQDTAEMFKIDNIGNLYSLSDDKIEAIHEKFAQTAEMYFLEGKFENNKFRDVMEHLRKGMLKIIEIVGNAYPQFGSFKIDPKVERIFETILGASSRVEDAVLPLIEPPMFPIEMLGADGPKYMSVLDDVENEAIGQIYTDSFLTQEKQREKEGLKRLKEFTAKAEAQVDERPAFSLMKLMKENYAAYVKNGKKGTDPRFSFESIAEYLFNGDEDGAALFKKGIPDGIISGKKKGGMDIGNWMAEARIADPNEMIEAIAEMSNRDMRVDEIVDQLIDEALPSLKTDEEIHDMAEAAVQNTAKEKRLNMEMDFLVNKEFATLKGIAAKLINPARYVGKLAKEGIANKAFAKIMKTPVGMFSPKSFLVNSDKHGRDASKLFKAKALVESIESKYKQMIDFKAYQYAQAAFSKLAKVDKNVKKINKYGGRKEAAAAFDVEVLNEGKRIIADAINGEVAPMDISLLHELSGMTPDMVKEINSTIEKYNALSNGKGSMSNTVQARLAFGEVLKKVISSSRKARGAEKAEKVTQEDITVANIVGGMSKFAGTIDLSKEDKVSRVKAGSLNPYWLFETLIPDFYNSDMFKILGKQRNSEGVSSDNKKELKRQIVEEFNKINPTNVKNLKDVVKAVASGKKENLKEVAKPFLTRLNVAKVKPIVMSDIGVTLKNDGELLKAMLLMGSNSGAVNFLGRNTALALEYDIEGDAVSAGQLNTDAYKKNIQDLIDKGDITIDHINFLNKVWGIFNDLHPLISDAMRYTDGHEVGKIEATPMEFYIKGEKVILTGGYAPISVKAELRTDTSSQDFLSLDAHGISGMAMTAKTGITKERTGGRDPIDLDISTLLSYINAASDIAYLRKDLSDTRRILMRPEFKDVLEQKAPGAFHNVIKPWFKRTATQVFTEYKSNPLENLARSGRAGANAAMYSLSIPNAMIQTLGFFQSYNRLKGVNKNAGKYLMAAATQKIMKTKAISKSVMEASAVMRERKGTSIVEQHRSISFLENTNDWIGNTTQISKAIAGYLSQTSQQYVDEITWTAAYLMGKDGNMSHEDARNLADDVVIRSQGSMLPSALSNIQEGTDINKFLMMATNIKVINANELMLAMGKNVEGDPRKIKAISGTLAIGLAMPFLLERLVRDSVKKMFGDDEEEEDKEKKAKKENFYMAASATSNLLGTAYPIVGNVMESILVYKNASAGAGFSQLGKLGTAADGTYNIWRGVNTSAREKRAMLDAFTFISQNPIPSMAGRIMGLNEATKSSEELEEEKYTRQYQLEDLREDLY